MQNIKHYDLGRFALTIADKMIVVSYFIKSELQYTLGFDWFDGFTILFKRWK